MPFAFTFSRMKRTTVSSEVPGPKTAATPFSLEEGKILLGNGSAQNHQDVVGAPFFQHGGDARDDGVVRAGEDAEPDAVHIFLEGRVDDHLRRLAQAGVDDFHAGVAQRAGNDLGATVVAVEARFGHQDANGRGALRHRNAEE